MKCIDLYSGIGGWTLGMKLSGIENTYSFEWNKESNQTHNENFGTSIKETNIRELEITDLLLPKDVDFIVGSPHVLSSLFQIVEEVVIFKMD